MESYHKEDVMLACVLDDKQSSTNKFRFLEIDVNSKFFVNRVSDEHRLFKKTRVQKALRNCHTDSEKWCQQLKVIHHIYPSKNPPTEGNNEKPKRTRRVSLGDKKTVKSASFRYSTSYAEDSKPVYRNPPNMYKPVAHAPPVYLNITCKPNEENCSSLPTQKSNRTVFENEILQCIMKNQRQTEQPAIDRFERSNRDKDRLRKPASDYSYQKPNDRPAMVTNIDYRMHVTKNNYIANEKIPKYSDPRYRVVRKENSFFEKEVSSDQPVYKTQVMVKIDDSYSDAVDAIRSKNSSNDNIYAEINEYPQLVKNFPIFSKKTCFVNENCSRSYIIVPSTSTVNVS